MMFAVEVTLIFKGLKANIIFRVMTTSRPKYCRMQSSIFDLVYLDFKSFMNKTTYITQTKFMFLLTLSDKIPSAFWNLLALHGEALCAEVKPGGT